MTKLDCFCSPAILFKHTSALGKRAMIINSPPIASMAFLRLLRCISLRRSMRETAACLMPNCLSIKTELQHQQVHQCLFLYQYESLFKDPHTLYSLYSYTSIQNGEKKYP